MIRNGSDASGAGKRLVKRALSLGFLFVLSTSVSIAHHSFAMFDDTKELALVGVVKEFQWTNPHTWIQLNVADESGTLVEWSIEGGSPGTLSRQGWTKNTFRPGDKVSIKVHPMKDGSAAGGFIGAQLADGSTIGRWETKQQ